MKRSSTLEKIALLLLLISTFVSFSIYVYFSTKKYFMGDDFSLLLSTYNLKGLLIPIGNHFRPIVRLHFLFNKFFGFNPFIFNILSLFLHFLASFSLYLVLKEEKEKKFALFVVLIFFSFFAHNESFYWISAIGVLYCFIFALLSIYFLKKDKIILSIFFMFLSSFCYETWLVLPVYFAMAKRKNFLLQFSSFFLILFHFFISIKFKFYLASYGGFAPLKEIPMRISYYLFKSLFPFSSISEKSIFAFVFILFIPFFIYIVLKKGEKILIPFIFYFVPATMFLMSHFIGSRFFYFPVVSIAMAIGYIFFSKNPYNYLGFFIILYISILSPLLNYLDGKDYLEYSLKFKSIIDSGRSLLSGFKEGDVVTVINRFSRSLTEETARAVRGSVKLFLHRGKGIGGLIDLEIFVNFILRERGLKSEPFSGDEKGKRIIIGKGDFVSKYKFQILKIGN